MIVFVHTKSAVVSLRNYIPLISPRGERTLWLGKNALYEATQSALVLEAIRISFLDDNWSSKSVLQFQSTIIEFINNSNVLQI